MGEGEGRVRWLRGEGRKGRRVENEVRLAGREDEVEEGGGVEGRKRRERGRTE